MNTLVKGRKLLIRIILLIVIEKIILNSIVVIDHISNGNFELLKQELISDIIIFVLQGVILFFLFKGYKWAKWFIIIGFSIGILLMSLALIANFNVLYLVSIILHLWIVITLIKSENIKVFLYSQRED